MRVDFASCELKFASCEFQFGSQNLRVQKCELRVSHICEFYENKNLILIRSSERSIYIFDNI